MTTEPMKQAAEQAAARHAAADKPTSPDADPTESDRIVAELEATQAELAQLHEDILRERADLANQRRRLERERDTAQKFANERLLGDLLPVIDSLEAGLLAPDPASSAPASGDSAAHLREGMQLTLRQLLKVAADNGLVAIDPVAQPFNPEHHQAMSTVASDEVAPDHVVQVYQKGWLLNDRLLRPALVVVSKHD